MKFASYAIDDRDPLVFHKTTARSRYDVELERCQPCDDVIFWNCRGEVTESTIANVVVFSEGNTGRRRERQVSWQGRCAKS